MRTSVPEDSSSKLQRRERHITALPPAPVFLLGPQLGTVFLLYITRS